MDSYQRHKRIWPILYGLVRPLVRRRFALRSEEVDAAGPILLIANHVTTWDPLLVAMSLKRKQVYFVASEHLFRLGLISRAIRWLVAPIPRRKGAAGTDTVRACLRLLRAGHSVCLFAEGECCWDGRTGPIFPATGKLAKASGATLVTYRLEGGYLSLPRWTKRPRRGRVCGHPVGVYGPEVLAAMSADEVNALIQRDIQEDAWQRQREEPIAYRGRRRAEGLERALYLCPACGGLDTLKSEGDRLDCACGLSLRYTETGFFSPEEPFPSLAEWEQWQRQALRQRPIPAEGPMFSDRDVELRLVGADHSQRVLGRFSLEQYADRLCCGDYSFPLEEISYMAMVMASKLLFRRGEDYYEVQAGGRTELRKYLEIWKNAQGG